MKPFSSARADFDLTMITNDHREEHENVNHDATMSTARLRRNQRKRIRARRRARGPAASSDTHALFCQENKLWRVSVTKNTKRTTFVNFVALVVLSNPLRALRRAPAHLLETSYARN